MNSNGPAQAFETPFNISDYVDFDFDVEAIRQSVHVSSEASVVEPLQRLSICDPYASIIDAVDADFAGIFQLPDGSNALDAGFNATQAASEDDGVLNALQAPTTGPISTVGFPTQSGPWKSRTIDAFDNFIETNAAFGDPTALNPASEHLGMTDAFQTTIETHSPRDDSTVFESTAFNPTVDPATLEIPCHPSSPVSFPMQEKANERSTAVPEIVQKPSMRVISTPETQREPSRWVPASPRLQEHLNKTYASQILQICTQPNVPPMLYFPMQQQVGPLPSDPYSQRSIPTQYGYSQVSQPSMEISSIESSLVMARNNGLSPPQQLSNGVYRPIPPITDHDAPNAEDLALTPTKKRALDANEHDSESAPKRAKTAEVKPLSTVAMDDGSDDDDEPVRKRTRTARRNPFSTVAKDDESEVEGVDESEIDPDDEPDEESEDDPNDEAYDSDSSGLSSAPPSPILRPTAGAQKCPSTLLPRHSVLKESPQRRYEQEQESRPLDQQRKQWVRRHANSPDAKGKAPNRKMQNLLKEIEDTEGFAEAQGYEVRESVERDSLPRRPVRKGARKSYVGQE